MKKTSKKGFTLIELLIVVAIIAILAAIAIPQFAQYRIKGYNAAGSSDLRNAKTAEEALFADFQAYGDTTDAVITSGPTSMSTQDVNGNTRSLEIGLSNGVHIFSKTNATAVGGAGSNYLIYTKHKQGDRTFMADGNAPTIYWLPATPNDDLVDLGYDSTDANDVTASGSATPL